MTGIRGDKILLYVNKMSTSLKIRSCATVVPCTLFRIRHSHLDGLGVDLLVGWVVDLLVSRGQT